MHKVVKNKKEFKIIPEARLVSGAKMPRRYIRRCRGDFTSVEQGIIDVIALRSKEAEHFENGIIYANAYCDEKDEFDENVGVEVAEAKLDLKEYKRMAHQCDRVINILLKLVVKMTESKKKYEKKIEAIEDDLARMYGRGKV